MTIDEHLDRLRAKPESFKQKAAFLGSLCITLIIFAFWTMSVFDKFAVAEPAAVIETTPADSIVSNLSEGVDNIKTQFQELFKLLK